MRLREKSVWQVMNSLYVLIYLNLLDSPIYSCWSICAEFNTVLQSVSFYTSTSRRAYLCVMRYTQSCVSTGHTACIKYNERIDWTKLYFPILISKVFKILSHTKLDKISRSNLCGINGKAWCFLTNPSWNFTPANYFLLLC